MHAAFTTQTSELLGEILRACGLRHGELVGGRARFSLDPLVEEVLLDFLSSQMVA